MNTLLTRLAIIKGELIEAKQCIAELKEDLSTSSERICRLTHEKNSLVKEHERAQARHERQMNTLERKLEMKTKSAESRRNMDKRNREAFEQVSTANNERKLIIERQAQTIAELQGALLLASMGIVKEVA